MPSAPVDTVPASAYPTSPVPPDAGLRSSSVMATSLIGVPEEFLTRPPICAWPSAASAASTPVRVAPSASVIVVALAAVRASSKNSGTYPSAAKPTLYDDVVIVSGVCSA